MKYGINRITINAGNDSPWKGEVNIEHQILFGKYRLERVLGTGGTATVYLATHLGLGEYRAIKKISKESEEYGQFRKEGLILKYVRNPGIPIVYDLEEDDSYGYLIEEYLEGESLAEIIKEQGPLSTARTVSYGIQICHLVNHLHSARITPILYLDIQPRNLLLCGNRIKLVDFGCAAFLKEGNSSCVGCGTPGFAAPEQYAGKTPDERTDIYGIGAVLYFLWTGRSFSGYWENMTARKGAGQDKLKKIIKKCLATRRERRYGSVMELEKALERMETPFLTCCKRKQKRESFPVIIAFAGSHAGAGTTHLAIGMAAYLRDQNFKVCYEEKNGNGVVRELLRCQGKGLDRHGVAKINGIFMRPRFMENVCLEEEIWDIVIWDLGTEIANERDWDYLIEVRDGKWWNSRRCLKEEPVLTLLNHNLDAPGQNLQTRERKNLILSVPYFPNPFFFTGKAELFYRRLSVLCGIEKKRKKLWSMLKNWLEK